MTDDLTAHKPDVGRCSPTRPRLIPRTVIAWKWVGDDHTDAGDRGVFRPCPFEAQADLSPRRCPTTPSLGSACCRNRSRNSARSSKKWAEIIATGSVDAHKEQEILGDFVNDVFCELLGYSRAVDNPGAATPSRA